MSSSTVVIEGAHGIPLTGDRWEAENRSPRRGSIILLHGGGQTRYSWHDTGSALAADGWQVLSMDARGHGESGWDPTADYSFDAFVDDLQHVMAGLGDAPVLIGASMGGLTALLQAGEHPDTVRGLVLVDIAPHLNLEGTQRVAEFMRSAPDGFGSLEEASDAISGYNPHRPKPTSVDGLRKNLRLRENGRWYWHWDPRFFGQGDEATNLKHVDRLIDAARAVTVPVMLVRGLQSDVVTDESVDELRRLIPDVHIESVTAGHMLAGDNNAVFADHVLSFVNGLP